MIEIYDEIFKFLYILCIILMTLSLISYNFFQPTRKSQKRDKDKKSRFDKKWKRNCYIVFSIIFLSSMIYLMVIFPFISKIGYWLLIFTTARN